MEKETDIAIIGGGMATLAAAVELESSSLEVLLIRKAPGAAALSSGAWDLADHPLRHRTDAWNSFPSISKNILEIIRRQEFHPYGVLSEALPANQLIPFLKDNTVRVAEALPLGMKGDLEQNMALLTDFGTVRSAAMAQASMRAADVSRMDRAKLLVVGFKGFPNFNAAFICQFLRESKDLQPTRFIESADYFEATPPKGLSQAGLLAIELAQAFDREDTFVAFGKQVADFIRGKKFTHLLLPPILGIKNTTQIVSALEKITGMQVGEVLASPMSVPGWRLSEAILHYFKKKEYDVLEGEVVGFDCERRRIKSLRVHQGEKRIRVQARKYILAGGKYLGGGIDRKRRFRESIFGLPVYAEGKPVGETAVLRISGKSPWAPQPFLSAGVAVDFQTRPLDHNGEAAYENLFAAGSILSGLDPTRDRSTTGVSILSGTLAGRYAKQS
jgi:glycerol-3-phosphate dehydrogenase subunit B